MVDPDSAEALGCDPMGDSAAPAKPARPRPRDLVGMLEQLRRGSAAERTEVAHSCAVGMRTSIPVLIDEIDNEVARQYGGWPDRLYLIGRDGRIAFQGAEGPFGFKPEQLEQAIEAELAPGRLDNPPPVSA